MPSKFISVFALLCLFLSITKADHVKTRDNGVPTTTSTTGAASDTPPLAQATNGTKPPPKPVTFRPFPLMPIPFPAFCTPTLGRYNRGFLLLVAANIGGNVSVQINALIAQHLLNARLPRKLEDQIEEAIKRDNCETLTVTEGLQFVVNKTKIGPTDLETLYISANCLKPTATIEVGDFLAYIQQNATDIINATENTNFTTVCPPAKILTNMFIQNCQTPPCNPKPPIGSDAGGINEVGTPSPNATSHQENNNQNQRNHKSRHAKKDRSHHEQKHKLQHSNKHSSSHREHKNRASPHELHKARSHVNHQHNERHQSNEKRGNDHHKHKDRLGEKERRAAMN